MGRIRGQSQKRSRLLRRSIANLRFARTAVGFVNVEVRLEKKRSSPNQSLHLLGKYLSLALTLPASVFAGYLVGAAADHWLKIPFLRAVGILLGMIAGIYQILRELARDERRSKP